MFSWKAAAFKPGVDRWETFLTYGNAKERNIRIEKLENHE